ncbi:Gfo/Idh/MocA family protein [Nonomuraea sp. NPDC004297]
MTDLRLAVIGAGQRISIAQEAHRPGEGARVESVCDLDEARLAAARQLFGPGTRTSNRVRDALDDVDAVIIASPDHLHAGHAVEALSRGLPTFVEKPLAVTVRDCDDVLEAAMRHRARLYVGHNMRHMPVIRHLRELIRQGTIGEVRTIWCRHFVGHGGDYYFKDWHADRRRTTGLLLQKGAHDIDVIHWLTGARTELVTAMGGLSVYDRVTDRRADDQDKDEHWFDPARNWPPLAQRGLNPVVDVEDLSMMLMRLDNGVQASYQQCHYTPDYWRNYTVIGTEGRMENFGDHRGESVIRVWNRGRRDYDADGDLVVPVREQAGGHGGADRALMSEFLRFARHGGATETSPVAARDAVAAAALATESLRDGSRPRTVPPVAPELAAYFAAGQVSPQGRQVLLSPDRIGPA